MPALRAGMWAVVFTDLVGSTEQRARVGDTVADALRREHDSIVERVSATSGGAVVKGTGDGAMVVFAGAADAISAGASIQQAVWRRNQTSLEPIAVRIGISLGDLAHENGDLFGMAANEAARLCSHAGAGEVLIADVVRAVAGSRNTWRLVQLAPVDLKGIPDAVMAWRVDWEPVGAPSLLGFPRAMDRSDALPFIGRDSELARFRAAFEGVRRGEPVALFLSGEPGIGKTRLASQLARAAYDEGALVLYGRADEQLGVPFQPFVEILTAYFEQSEAPRFGRYPEELARIAPAVVGRASSLDAPQRSDPATEQYRLFDALRSWIQSVAAEVPVVLVLDDLHWATPPTMSMLLHLLRPGDTGQLLVLGTLRDTEVLTRDASALWDELKRLPAATVVPLGGLDPGGVDRLIALELDVEDDRRAELAEAIVTRTGGNPFFIVELLRDLRESGTDPARSETAPEFAAVSRGAVQAVEYRIVRLDKEVQSVLAIAAVVGIEFQVDVLAALSEMAPRTALLHLRSAMSAKLVHEVDADVYAFSHALVQAALEQQHTASERQRLHRDIAENLNALRPKATTAIAFHWCAAASCADPHLLVDAVLTVGREALLRSAPEEAVEWYRRGELAALAVIDPNPTALRQLWITAGTELLRAGQQREAAEFLQAALEGPDAEPLTRAAIFRLLGCGYRTRRSYAEATDAFRRASEALLLVASRDQTWWSEWLQTHLELMELYYWTNAPAEMAVLEESLSADIQLHGLANQRAAYAKNAAMRQLRERRYVIDDNIERLLDDAVTVSANGDAAHAFHLFNRGFAALWRRDLSTAERYLRASLDLSERTGDAVVATRCWTYLSVAARFDRNVDELRQRVASSVELAEACGLTEYTAAANGNRAWALLQEARTSEARDAALQATQLWQELPITYAFQWLARFPLLSIAVELDDLDLARTCVVAMLDLAQQKLPDDIDHQLHATQNAETVTEFGTLLRRASRDGYT